MSRVQPSNTVPRSSRRQPRAGRVRLGAITYGAIAHALSKLGYETSSARGSHVIFAHPNSRAQLILPWRSQAQTVDPTRLEGIFQLVASGGVATREELEDALKRD